MKVLAELHAYQSGVLREIEIPEAEVIAANGDREALLESAFYWGQNDVQPVERRCSLSVGDVIQIEDARYRVLGLGFVELRGDASVIVGCAHPWNPEKGDPAF